MMALALSDDTLSKVETREAILDAMGELPGHLKAVGARGREGGVGRGREWGWGWGWSTQRLA
jgi:hypothetical protein